MHPAGCGVNSWESDRSRLYYYQADPTIGLGSAVSVELPGRPEKGFVVSDQQTSCYKRTLNVWGGGGWRVADGPPICVQIKPSFSETENLFNYAFFFFHSRACRKELKYHKQRWVCLPFSPLLPSLSYV